MTAPRHLASGFPPFIEADWHAAVARVKRGATAPLRRESAGPLPRRVDARPVAGRPGGQLWVAVQRVDAVSAGEVAAAIAGDIAGGATGAELAVAGNPHPLGGRLGPAETAAVAGELAGLLPERFQLRLAAGDPDLMSPALLDLAAARGLDLVFAFDPVAALAAGRLNNLDDAGGGLKRLADAFEARRLRGAVVIADGRLWHAGGASDEQVLAATLATFVGHLRVLGTDAKIDVALAADADQYRTIATFRAMRLLLARVAEVAVLTGAPPRIHAETAWRTMSADSREINILRATSAAFAAAVGGADSITVLPFDAIGGAGDRHGRRLAGNTQTILAEEANLFRVADPAAGSGTIEAMTTALAEAAWKRFQAIEAEGGMVAAIGSGTLLREVAEARDARLARVAAGQTVMVGVNAYIGDQDTRAGAHIVRTSAGPARRLMFRRLSEAFAAPAS